MSFFLNFFKFHICLLEILKTLIFELEIIDKIFVILQDIVNARPTNLLRVHAHPRSYESLLLLLYVFYDLTVNYIPLSALNRCTYVGLTVMKQCNYSDFYVGFGIFSTSLSSSAHY